MAERTGCDAVMVSRGALGNPWVFREILEPGRPLPCVEEWLEVVLRHLDYHEEHYGPDIKPAVMMRKHLLWYVSGFPNAREARERLGGFVTLDEAREAVRRFAAGLPPGLVRARLDTPAGNYEKKCISPG